MIDPFMPNMLGTVSITSGLASARVALDTDFASQCRVKNIDAANVAFIVFGDSTATAVVPNGATPGSIPIGPGETAGFSIPPGTTHAASICTAGTPIVYFTPGSEVPPPLLSDNFVENGALNGRVPQIGPAWVTTGATGSSMVTLDGEMFQTGNGGAGYATVATSALIGEVGCKFRLSEVSDSMVISGAPAVGKKLIVNVFLSGSTGPNDFTQVSYTLVAGDTIATAATAWAAMITANATLAAAGISATADDNVVTVTSTTRSPRLVPHGDGLTINISATPTPTLAVYPTGGNFIAGMVHFTLAVSGELSWTIYNNGLVFFTSLNKRTVGLTPGVEYTYRCCIDPPYVWGGIWEGSTLLSAAVGQDASIATYRGASCFLETGLGAGVIFYNEAWAFRQPTVSRASIEAALT